MGAELREALSYKDHGFGACRNATELVFSKALPVRFRRKASCTQQEASLYRASTRAMGRTPPSGLAMGLILASVKRCATCDGMRPLAQSLHHPASASSPLGALPKHWMCPFLVLEGPGCAPLRSWLSFWPTSFGVIACATLSAWLVSACLLAASYSSASPGGGVQDELGF